MGPLSGSAGEGHGGDGDGVGLYRRRDAQKYQCAGGQEDPVAVGNRLDGCGGAGQIDRWHSGRDAGLEVDGQLQEALGPQAPYQEDLWRTRPFSTGST